MLKIDNNKNINNFNILWNIPNNISSRRFQEQIPGTPMVCRR
jgi:hypothetical protein